ncbi:MAG: hypothetical protein PUB37_07005 [Firmicutes bacterium]|nr:hypothetical protein [Bacillota bacterium]
MEQKAENTYSNVIAPSDGVRRLLCKTSVLFMGVIALVYSVFAFRMNAFEHSFSGGSLRTTMLYAAYFMFPLGILGAAICARIKQCGLAYCMIALLVADVGSFMLFLNSLSAFLRESDIQGYLGGAFELLAFAAVLAVLVNLTLSCMNFRLIPLFGTVGTITAVLALIITGARIAIAYSSMQFAWNSEFDWGNLALQVSGDNLQHQANWIFRCITLGSVEAEEMFMLRFCERISACLLYIAFIVFFVKYKNSMTNFNKLLTHASEYVDIPQANIAESIAETEKKIEEKLKSGTQSVKERLKNIKKSGNDNELPELFNPLNISENSDEPVSDGFEPPKKRRRPEEMSDEEMRERARRRRPEGMSDEEMRERARRREAEMTDEEKYLLEERRRRNLNYDENRRRQMNQSRQESEEERARRIRQARRRAESNASASDLNDYYDNYMKRRNDQIHK